MSYPYQQYPPVPAYQQPVPYASCPPPHWGWMVTAILFFWPLAIPSGINAARVESLYAAGDLAGAQKASEDAKKFGIIGLIIGLVSVVFGVVILIIIGLVFAAML
ncbi:MAG: CD225/dispanin family protein [Actinomycetia bacterium]|nr:CD225/dispanin family protein [Actinomycetes bacterium]